MKKIALLLIFILSGFAMMAQTYDPTKGVVVNKPIGQAQAAPTDSRSYFYDGTNFLWRPYQSTAEVLSYLNLAKYRTGQFSIYVNSGGTLNGNGTFTGGVILEYWFKNGVANGDLALKTTSIESGYAINVNGNTVKIDSANYRKVDSAYALNDSTLRILINGAERDIQINGNGGTGLDTLYVNNKGTGMKTSYTSGDSLNLKSLKQKYGVLLDSATSGEIGVKADTANLRTWISGFAGGLPAEYPINIDGGQYKLKRDSFSLKVIDNELISKAVVFDSYQQMRTFPTSKLLPEAIYSQHYNGTIGYWKYDASDNTTVDDSAMCIVTASGKRLKRVVPDGWVNAKWFGAVGDDVADDWYNLQRAINWCRDNYSPKLYIPTGTYKITKGLLVWKDANVDGNPEFLQIEIKGQGPTYDGGTNETTIHFTGIDDFAIGVQKGKGGIIRDLNINGMNTLNYATIATMWNPATTYVVNSCRTNVFSPYAGIVVDPFGSSTTGADRYPGFTGYYAGVVGNGGSTLMEIRNCRIDGFVAGIIFTPNGNTQNNELHILDKIWLNNVKDGIVTTNSQERMCKATNITSWGNTHTLFRTFGYGANRGEPLVIDGVNVAGGVYQLFDFYGYGGYFPAVSINHVYAELFYKIGRVVGVTATINESHLALGDPTTASMKMPNKVLEATSVAIRNSIMIYYNGALSVPFNVSGNIMLDNCYINNQLGVKYDTWTNEDVGIQYNNVSFYTRGGSIRPVNVQSGFWGYHNFASNLKFQRFGDQNMVYTYADFYGQKPAKASQIRRVISPITKRISLGSVSVTVTGNTATATIAALAGKSQFVNRVIWDAGGGDTSGSQVMRIASIDSVGNVTFDYVTDRFVTGTQSLWVEELQVLERPLVFDNSGSSMTNIYGEGSTAAQTLSTTKTYYFDGYPVTVSAASAGTATANGFLPYQSSATRGVLSEYAYDESGQSSGNPLTNAFFTDGAFFTRGAFYLNTKNDNTADSSILGWVVIKTGVKGSSVAPEFKTIYKTSVAKLVNDAAADAAGESLYYSTTSNAHKIKNSGTWYDILTTGSGLSTLNGLSDVTQTFATGTTGSDFAIVSAAGVHTFNIPNAANGVRGLVSTGSQDFQGVKNFLSKPTGGGAVTSSSFEVGNFGISNSAAAQIKFGPFNAYNRAGWLVNTDYMSLGINAANLFTNDGTRNGSEILFDTRGGIDPFRVFVNKLGVSAQSFGVNEDAELKVGGGADLGAYKFQVSGASILSGSLKIDLGSDASWDTYTRNGSGVIQRIANGTTGQAYISTASASPSWGTLGVVGGGTGLTTTTAYGVIIGGTTSTGNFQNAGTGTTGQILKSNGASSVPTWVDPLPSPPKFTAVTADPTDWTIATNTFTTLPDLSGVANHTVTLPSAASNSGVELVIWNNSSDATFKWSYAAAITLADGTTRTTFADGTIDRLISNGTTWIKNN